MRICDSSFLIPNSGYHSLALLQHRVWIVLQKFPKNNYAAVRVFSDDSERDQHVAMTVIDRAQAVSCVYRNRKPASIEATINCQSLLETLVFKTCYRLASGNMVMRHEPNAGILQRDVSQWNIAE